MTTRYEIGLPSQDINGNFLSSDDLTNVQNALEPFAVDGSSHFIGQYATQSGGVAQSQNYVIYWIIADADLANAQTTFNNFCAGFTFAVTPEQHAWSLSL